MQAGIAVGATAGAVLLAALLYGCCCRRKRGAAGAAALGGEEVQGSYGASAKLSIIPGVKERFVLTEVVEATGEARAALPTASTSNAAVLRHTSPCPARLVPVGHASMTPRTDHPATCRQPRQRTPPAPDRLCWQPAAEPDQTAERGGSPVTGTNDLVATSARMIAYLSHLSIIGKTLPHAWRTALFIVFDRQARELCSAIASECSAAFFHIMECKSRCMSRLADQPLKKASGTNGTQHHTAARACRACMCAL